MITDFKALTIPEGEVVKIEDSQGRVLWQKASPLPYVPFDYVESNGSAYIDTGIKGIGKLAAESKFLFKQTTSGWGALCGVRYGNNNRCYLFAYSNESNKGGFVNGYITNYSVLSPKTVLQPNTIYEGTVTLESGSQSYVINNIVFDAATETGALAIDYNIYLFGVHYQGNTDRLVRARIWSFKIWQNDVLVRDFKPCTYQGEAGMWDVVSNQFYGNANSSGTLTAGNDA